MSAFEHENSIYFGFGEAEPVESTFTDEDWAEYDRLVGQEIAEWEAQTAPFDEFLADDSIEPPF